jgi:ankyrin repeat protein
MSSLRYGLLFVCFLLATRFEHSSAQTASLALPDSGSPLYEAVKAGNRAEALRLISAKSGLNDVSQAGFTPLYQAIWRKDEVLVIALVKNGANTDRISRDGANAMHLAGSVGSLSLIKQLRELGVDADPQGPGQRSALLGALCSSSAQTEERWAVVEYLIPLTDLAREKGPDLTSLYCAARSAPIHIINALIKHGAPIPSTESIGPILFQTNNFDVLRALVNLGADVHATDKWKRSLLHFFGGTNVEVTKYLLNHGLNVNARDNRGRTALLSAANSMDTTVAALLLERGADIHALDDDGNSALFYAATPPNVAATKFLLRRGVEPKARNTRGETALHAALRYSWDVRSERAELTRLLLENGVDPNALDYTPVAPLHIAASRLERASMKVLLNHGADPNLVGWRGKTPLHLAASVKINARRPMPADMSPPSHSLDRSFIDKQVETKRAVIALLLKRGANKQIRDASNLRPVELLGNEFEEDIKLMLN